ncbi:sigma-70 family RNA polymerase sigma factor [Companilactobacillus sp. HBUAS56275]|jgi:RNA polymerase sigma factor, sigma-70 family|uniref:Sigma-70 family RNA polymerase sigma factor n=1 Tax=Candidatus Companilactobacillus pullicola TaxID=2838523 RepID=A0A9D1ZLT2_9LACO|nr:sigma-70 family RNA polymerase sigma factor [Candidatus Companilactobacillus pullicola]
MKVEQENQWIELIKEHDDSIALDRLVRRYRPMIDNMYTSYFIEGYDRNDWYQEAFLVCYQTCKLFDGNSGSKFGSFFKLKFQNHIIDIIRRENAVKRKANHGTESYDELLDNGKFDDKIAENNDCVDMTNELEKIMTRMSNIELVAFQFLLGKLSMYDACLKARCNMKQIIQATNRCKKKIKHDHKI